MALGSLTRPRCSADCSARRLIERHGGHSPDAVMTDAVTRTEMGFADLPRAIFPPVESVVIETDTHRRAFGSRTAQTSVSGGRGYNAPQGLL